MMFLQVSGLDVKDVILTLAFTTVLVITLIEITLALPTYTFIMNKLGGTNSVIYPFKLHHETNKFLFKINNNLGFKYHQLGFDSISSRSLSSVIGTRNPILVYQYFNKNFHVVGGSSVNYNNYLEDDRSNSVYPPDVVMLTLTGDCDDYSYLVASMYNESYIIYWAIVDTVLRQGAFHATPLIPYGGKWYIPDVVGGILVVGKTPLSVIRDYERISYSVGVNAYYINTIKYS